MQWTCDELRLRCNPSATLFPIELVSDLIHHYKTHEKIIAVSKTLAEAIKPEKFKETTKGEDWLEPTFINYSRSIPGRDGIPLKYNILLQNDDFLDNNVANAALLEGNSYAIVTVKVHTFHLNFVTGKRQKFKTSSNQTTNSRLLSTMREWLFMQLISVRRPDEVLKTLFCYAGEKSLHMWWSEFEKWLTRAFNAYVKREGRIVHSDSMKIRMLVDKIKADSLTPTKGQLEIKLLQVPTNIMYEKALSLFRIMVNQKHHPRWELHKTDQDAK